jgi:L-lactate dehydrogenase complex protein LldE
MLRQHFPSLLGKEVQDSSAELVSRTYELSEFLVGVLGVEALGEGLAGLRICYHHGCHALRMLGVRNEPLVLLRGAGAEIVSWEAEEDCCGFGGIFSVKVPSVSSAMADWKLDTLPQADVVTSTDGGCLLQLSGRARSRRLDLTFKHLASLLWEATSPVRGAGS